MKLTDQNKVKITFVIFILLFTLVFSKAIYVQIIIRDKLIKYYDSQLIRETVLYPKRGNIYDANGEPLAINIQRYSIFTIPKNFSSQKKNYQQLAKLIPELSLKTIKKKVDKRRRYTWLIRKVELSDEKLKKIEEIEDIYVSPEPGRFYPNHELLAQTLGFVGIDNVGLSGIEFRWDKELRGVGQVVKYMKDAKGRPIKFETSKGQGRAEDIYLSIAKDTQAVAEKYLKEGVQNANATRGGVGIMDADTGEVLALANYPAFDPNEYHKYPNENRKLAFVTDPFEPGSVFKILTVASAFQNRIASPETNYYCEKGSITISGHTITEAETHEKFEWLSVADIIKFSSNIGVTKIAFDVTFPLFKKTLEDFNILNKTGIELPGESRGIFQTKEGGSVDQLSLSNMSFGQGIGTTAIQILSAYAAIANGGEYINPTIIKRRTNETIERRKVLEPMDAYKLQEILINAVEKGTGFNAKISHFRIAGKTGTAQKASKNGKYEGYISSFAGFPVGTEKKYVVFVYIDEPKGGKYYANDVAAPVFKKVMSYLLYKDKDSSKLAFNNKNGLSDVIDDVQTRLPSVREFGEAQVPNFVGLDKLAAGHLAKKYRLQLVNKGNGLVISQNILAGEKMGDAGSIIELNYAPPSYE